jgi:hypothetical protein
MTMHLIGIQEKGYLLLQFPVSSGHPLLFMQKFGRIFRGHQMLWRLKFLPQDWNAKQFLMVMHHLKRYPMELECEAMFDISRMWGNIGVIILLRRFRHSKPKRLFGPIHGMMSGQ